MELWIARNDDGSVWAYETEPEKTKEGWSPTTGRTVFLNHNIFDDIKADDNEPTKFVSVEKQKNSIEKMESADRSSKAMQQNLSITQFEVTHSYPESKINHHKHIIEKLNKLYRDKNADYGDSFAELWSKLGVTSGVSQIAHKTNRLVNLIDTDKQEVKDESLLDTLYDLANYSIMAIIELEREGDE